MTSSHSGVIRKHARIPAAELCTLTTVFLRVNVKAVAGRANIGASGTAKASFGNFVPNGVFEHSYKFLRKVFRNIHLDLTLWLRCVTLTFGEQRLSTYPAQQFHVQSEPLLHMRLPNQPIAHRHWVHWTGQGAMELQKQKGPVLTHPTAMIVRLSLFLL